MKIIFYCINLQKSIERKEKMIKQFKKYDFDHKIIEGIDGSESEEVEKYSKIISYDVLYNWFEKKLWAINKLNTNYINNNIGCTLSHIKAINLAYNDKLDYVFISEDDTLLDYFHKNIKEFEQIIKKLNNNWEAIQLTTHNSEAFKLLNEKFKKGDNFIVRKDHNINNIFESAGVYLINKKGMEKICNMYSDDKIYDI